MGGYLKNSEGEKETYNKISFFRAFLPRSPLDFNPYKFMSPTKYSCALSFVFYVFLLNFLNICVEIFTAAATAAPDRGHLYSGRTTFYDSNVSYI